MAQKRVGIRQLKAQLSGYIREIKKGHSVVITERGTEVGRIIPDSEDLEERIKSLVRSGFAEWNGKPLKPGKAAARIKPGAKTLAEIVIVATFDQDLWRAADEAGLERFPSIL
jgi:prevent-host-death family protein